MMRTMHPSDPCVCFQFKYIFMHRYYLQVTVHTPINRHHGNLELALYGSFLPVPDLGIFEESPKMEMVSLTDIICINYIIIGMWYSGTTGV